MYPNKPTLFVAPNGFGKSSIAIAFDSLKKNKISLNKEFYHKNNQNNLPKLKITIINENKQEVEFKADKNSNSINKEFDIFIINNKLVAKTKNIKINWKTTVPYSYLTIEKITLINNVPKVKNKSFNYSLKKYRKKFGPNGKILPDISSILKNKLLITKIYDYVNLDKFKQKRITNNLNKIINNINNLKGTANTIKEEIKKSFVQKLEKIIELKKIAEIISNEYENLIDRYLAALQIVIIFKENPALFNEIYTYFSYKLKKEEYIKLFEPFKNLWKNIKPKEKNGKLILEFPEANKLSNGERDIIIFLALLQKAKYKLKKEKCILIIDEIFDYLDDINLVSAQYYITKFIKDFKNQGKIIFPIIMTHLDSELFRNYAFSKIQKFYLNHKDLKNEKIYNGNFKKILMKRNENSIKNDLDKYFLHYHPNSETINIREEFKALSLKETWGEFKKFKEFIDNEFDNYIENISFCTLAVCTKIRIKIEENIFRLINNPSDKDKFIEEKSTRKKLEFALSIGINVPEIYFLLGIIYNDCMHISNGREVKINYIKSKLDNITIKEMIKLIDKVI